MLLPVTWSLVPVNASYQDSQTTTGTYSLFWSTTGVGVHHSQSATWNHCFEWSFVCEDGTRCIDVGHQRSLLQNYFIAVPVVVSDLFFFGWSHGIIWYCTALYSYVRIETSGTRYLVPGMGIIHGSRVPVYEPGSNLPGTSGGIHSGPLFVGFCLLIIPWLIAVIEKFIYVLKRVFYRNSQTFKWTYQGTYFRNVWTTTSRYFGCI